MTIVEDTGVPGLNMAKGDWLKGLTLGEPDGPMRFIPQFGFEVPTYIDPREDLKNFDPKSENAVIRVDYHIPFAKRGKFKIYDWPEPYRLKYANQRIDLEGFCLCMGLNSAGLPCGRFAVNRTHFCSVHGGGLHRADKKLSQQANVNIPQDRVEKLDRPQQFMQGFLSVEDLDDDEIKGKFIRNRDGFEVKARALGIKFEQEITKEFHRRINEYLISKTPKALQVLTEIIESDMVEPADRLKAIGMLTDRTLGKPADIILHGNTDKPYESIFDEIENGGSREDYRKRVASTRLEIESSGSEEPQDAEEVNYESYDSEEVPLEGLSGNENVHDSEESGLRRDMDHDKGTNVDRTNASDDTRDENETLGVVDEITARRAALKAAKSRIQNAKKRRFAARAVGASSVNSVPFGLEFHIIKSGKFAGKLRMRLVAPSAMSEARLARMANVNETTDLALSLLYGDEQSR